MVLMRNLTLAALACLAGCAISMDPPDGFLELETPGRDFKATTADGARLWVREFDDPHEGALSFWADALEHDLVNERGYVLVDRSEIEDKAGRDGVVQRYSLNTEGQPHGYLVAVFINGDCVRIAEFVAPRDAFDDHVEAVQASLRTLQ